MGTRGRDRFGLAALLRLVVLARRGGLLLGVGILTGADSGVRRVWAPGRTSTLCGGRVVIIVIIVVSGVGGRRVHGDGQVWGERHGDQLGLVDCKRFSRRNKVAAVRGGEPSKLGPDCFDGFHDGHVVMAVCGAVGVEDSPTYGSLALVELVAGEKDVLAVASRDCDSLLHVEALHEIRLDVNVDGFDALFDERDKFPIHRTFNHECTLPTLERA